MALAELLGLTSIWNSFWLPLKLGGLYIRTSGPYSGENTPETLDLTGALLPVFFPEMSSPASQRSYRAVRALSYLPWLTFMSWGRSLRTSGRGTLGPLTANGACAWVV